MINISTPFIDIYRKANILFDDTPLLSDLTDDEYDELLELFLSKSRSIYFKSCKKDLTDIESYDYYTKEFVADGVNNTFVIDDYPIDPNEDTILLICKVNDVNITTYTFDDTTLTFTITSTLVDDDDVECGFSFSGQFNEDLDDEEQWILAHGILLTWYSRKLYKEENMRDRLTTKDYNASHSPGNLIDKLMLLKKESEKELKNLVNDYTFNDFEGFD